MKVANGKSEKATGDLIDLLLSENELCLRLIEFARSASDVVHFESTLKAEFRGLVSKTATELRRSQVTARGQAEFRQMSLNCQAVVDWTLIAHAFIEGAQGE